MISNIAFKNCCFEIPVNKELIRIWSIAVAIVLVTLLGLFMVDIIPLL